MLLAPMRFKDYVFPHNPKTYTITYERSVGEHKVPFGRYVLQNTGMTHRVMRGQGEFAGEGAYDEFKKLAAVFYSETPGILVHPVWQSAKAYFVALSLLQEPRADWVSYSFEFWECYDGYDGAQYELTAAAAAQTAAAKQESAEYHTVVSGETLWGIAVKYGLTLSALLELNAGIKNPNLIYAGDRVRVK